MRIKTLHNKDGGHLLFCRATHADVPFGTWSAKFAVRRRLTFFLDKMFTATVLGCSYLPAIMKQMQEHQLWSDFSVPNRPERQVNEVKIKFIWAGNLWKLSLNGAFEILERMGRCCFDGAVSALSSSRGSEINPPTESKHWWWCCFGSWWDRKAAEADESVKSEMDGGGGTEKNRSLNKCWRQKENLLRKHVSKAKHFP